MKRLRRPFILLVALSTLATLELNAQRLGPAPKRPKPAAIADTNDAQAYHDYGLMIFEEDPNASAAAFYWAARINPNLAGALYGLRSALILSNKGTLATFLAGGRRRILSKELRSLDSLYLRALMINPFLYTQLDRRILTHHIRTTAIQSTRMKGGGEPNERELNFLIESWLRDAGPEMRGWLAYSDGSFDRALDLYGDALKQAKFKVGLRIERARIMAMRGNIADAIAEFYHSLEEMRRRDTRGLVVFYNSKAVLEHSIGTLLEQAGDPGAAREAYGRALHEDSSYYPAHLRLALIAVDAKDSATAIRELELTTQIAADEPYVRFVHGFALAKFGRYPDAIVQLTKAVELEPFYAQPYALLAQLLEQNGDGPGALAAYNNFLTRASMRDPDRPEMTKRLGSLKKSMR